MTTDGKNRACLGAVTGAHGVKGDIRIKTFTDLPENVAAYGPVESEDGQQRFTIKVIRIQAGGVVIASAPEITDRDAAQALKGSRLYVDRSVLPAADEDEFYLDDLVGLNVVDETGAPFGKVSAVYNFGAGDLLELKDIPGLKGVRLIPFTKEAVPSVDIAAKCIEVMRTTLDEGASGTSPKGKDD